MEKYAVETSKIKTASAVTQCSICGKVAENHGSVNKCPVHGTEAFEKNETPRTQEDVSKLDDSGESL